MKIGLLSDTHSFIEATILEILQDCHEIWHAGDIGDLFVTDQLQTLQAPLRAVYGNIDNAAIRQTFPKDLIFECEGLKVWMTHIGAYPPKYTPKVKTKLDEIQPDLFVCGHSHILKVIADKSRNLLHLNPGAAGHHGFHTIRTLLLFDIIEHRPTNMQVVELGNRGQQRS
ncbi:MAG: metallophosphoesterase family protein [Bacteroidota bacterium]